jgi:hypothetical protein
MPRSNAPNSDPRLAVDRPERACSAQVAQIFRPLAKKYWLKIALLQKEQRVFERFPYAPVENCGAKMLDT